MSEKFSYRIVWSEEDTEYVGLCDQFPSLSWLAQRQIPIGTAYAVWTGIGAAGTFFVGVLYYGDPATFARYLGAALIVAGVVTLKLAH